MNAASSGQSGSDERQKYESIVTVSTRARIAPGTIDGMKVVLMRETLASKVCGFSSSHKQRAPNRRASSDLKMTAAMVIKYRPMRALLTGPKDEVGLGKRYASDIVPEARQ